PAVAQHVDRLCALSHAHDVVRGGMASKRRFGASMPKPATTTSWATYSSNPDPTIRKRKIEVKVNRPNLELRYRTEYTLKPTKAPESHKVKRVVIQPTLGGTVPS